MQQLVAHRMSYKRYKRYIQGRLNGLDCPPEGFYNAL